MNLIIGIIGAAICITGIWESLNLLRNYKLHQFLLQDFPKRVTQIRYCFSLSLRISLAVAGMGIIFRRDIFRKALLAVSFFTIVTIYYKHPPECFRRAFDLMSLPPSLVVKRDLMENILLMYNYTLDLLVSAGLIYFFTRPKIKQQFR